MEEIDTSNNYLVAVTGGGICLLAPPRPMAILSGDEALRLAAWLVCLAETQTETKFADVLEAIQST